MKILDKDIPILPILQFIEWCTDEKIATHFTQTYGKEMVICFLGFATKHNGFANSVSNAFPKCHNTSEQTIHKKMKEIIAKGLVDGCNCGCKGEFTITEAGRCEIKRLIKITT